MSLINEALRKARQAAAEHEEQQAPLRAPRAYPRRGRAAGPGAWLLVAVVAVLAAAIGGATVWWLVGRGPAPPPQKAAAGAVEATTAVDSGAQEAWQPGLEDEAPDAIVDGSGAETTAAEAEPTPAGPPATQETMSEISSGTEEPTPSPEQQNPDAGGSAVKVAPTGASSARSAQSRTGERIFVLDAEIDGRSLSLGYIVLRHVRPFAEINGVDVYEGSEVEGFTVEKIEADRVILRDANGPLELRTK